MPVHIYGHPVDMDPVLELAETHGLAIVEDAAEAHGAEYLVGSLDLAPGLAALRQLRDDEHLQLLRQQADHHR